MSLEQEFYNTDELAKLTGLTSGTLRVWRQYGKGPAFHKFGDAVRYRRADVESWLEQSLYGFDREKNRLVPVA